MESADSGHQHLVLCSGGPDSYITYCEVKRRHRYERIIPIYFNLGHRYAANEIRAVSSTVPSTHIDASFLSMRKWEDVDAYIFARNAILLVGMARYVTGPATLYLSVQKDELSLADRQPVFIDAMTHLFGILGLSVEVVSLWLTHDKTDMVKHFIDTGGSVDMLADTWSCYNPVGSGSCSLHCGNCPACIRRHISFLLGIGWDPTLYAELPRKSTTFLNYVFKAVAGAYSEARCQRIMEAAREGK